MRYIYLSNIKDFALIDDDDFDKVSGIHWIGDKIGNTYYASNKRKINGKTVKTYMHRFIMNPPSNALIDHKDHNGLNNQRYNLRQCTKGQNQINQRSQKYSTSKYLGVSWRKDRKKWVSQVCKNYKIHRCGQFDNEIDAAIAYNKKAKELHGEFANLNVV